MPIDSTIIDGIIYTELSGEINYESVIKHLDFILSLKDKVVVRYELHDHRNTESINLTTDDIHRIAVSSMKVQDIFQNSFLAVYAPDDFTFGIARMFEGFFEMEENPIEAGIFRKKEDAIRFLKAKMREYGST